MDQNDVFENFMGGLFKMIAAIIIIWLLSRSFFGFGPLS
jgi:hypothetical protein